MKCLSRMVNSKFVYTPFEKTFRRLDLLNAKQNGPAHRHHPSVCIDPCVCVCDCMMIAYILTRPLSPEIEYKTQ